MALTIQTEKGIFDLPRDFSVEIENTSPIYTDKGSQTIASTLPATGHNLSMVDYIHRPDIRNAPKRDAAAVVTDGVTGGQENSISPPCQRSRASYATSGLTKA